MILKRYVSITHKICKEKNEDALSQNKEESKRTLK
jgi:hypothetical protein